MKAEEEEEVKPKVVPLSLEELLAKRKAEQEAQSKVNMDLFCEASFVALIRKILHRCNDFFIVIIICRTNKNVSIGHVFKS